MENIIFKNNAFLINTKSTSYAFRISKYNHLEHVHYGNRININDIDSLAIKMVSIYGESVLYDQNDKTYCLDTLPLEYPTSGVGDFREPCILLNTANYVLDLKFLNYKVIKGSCKIDGLPCSYDADETLIITLKDDVINIRVDLYYALFYENDVITRRAVLINESENHIEIQKMMSFSIDLLEKNLELVTFNGGWINEANKTVKEIKYGTYINESRNGISSAKTNPGYFIKKKETTEDYGKVWGFNLVYSGSHYTSVSRNEKDNIRVMSGINPERFNYNISCNDSFETVEMILTFSKNGLNEMSHHFHDFINNHIIRGQYKNKPRPILINSWEAFMFDFKKANLISLAKQGKKLGMELFVLDDGWFKNRNDDTAGLGDYEVNLKKIPGGIKDLSDKIHNLGMQFGIWVEPEAVNPDSDLYRLHPEWAIENEHKTLYERNELLLDLTNKNVRDYIVANISKLIDENNIDYLKWDMNRQLNGIDGKYNYLYMKGLYEILDRIFTNRNILFESCASGGNRFDLGMLCYSPQIWTSDNTDAIERIRIQKNMSYLYPLSTLSSHLSATVSSQVLRKTPLHTRFHVACFGCLGYELDLTMLSNLEKKEVKKQIEFYKQYRESFQFGRFYRIEDDENKESFEVKGKDIIIGKFRSLMHVAPSYDRLIAKELVSEKEYKIISRPFSVNIEQFGQLINFILPIKVNSDGLVVKEASQFIGLDVKEETYYASGKALNEGIILNNLYNGTGYNNLVRIPLDMGSELYLVKEKEDEK